MKLLLVKPWLVCVKYTPNNPGTLIYVPFGECISETGIPNGMDGAVVRDLTPGEGANQCLKRLSLGIEAMTGTTRDPRVTKHSIE